MADDEEMRVVSSLVVAHGAPAVLLHGKLLAQTLQKLRGPHRIELAKDGKFRLVFHTCCSIFALADKAVLARIQPLCLSKHLP